MLLPVVAARPLEIPEAAEAVLLEAALVTEAAAEAEAEAALGTGQPIRREILV